AGNDGLTSFQVMYGFAMRFDGLAGSGTFLASARYTSLRVRLRGVPVLLCAMTRPSYPTLTSTMPVTPFFWQAANSLAFMRREALATSGYWGPTPLQKSLMPPPVPVLSTLGVLNLPCRPNCSATVVVKG